MRRVIERLFIISASMLALACTEQGEVIHKHEPSVYELENISDSQSDEAVDSLEAHQSYADWVSLLMQEGVDRVDDIIQPMFRQLFGDAASRYNSILNPEFLADKDNARSLVLLNQLLLQELKKDTQNQTIKSLRDEYLSIFIYHCAFDRTECNGLDFFSQASNTADFIAEALIAKPNMDVRTYYKYIYIAFTLKNRHYNKKLLELFVSRSGEYWESIRNQGYKEEDLFISMLNLSVVQLAENGESDLARELLYKLHFFDFSLTSLTSDQLIEGRFLMRLAASADYFYSVDGNLNPQLKQAMVRQEQESSSGRYKLNRLQSNKGDLLRALNFLPPDVESESYYIIDRLFEGHINIDMALILWSSVSNKNLDQFKNLVQRYVRLQFLNTLSITSDLAHELFNNPHIQTERLLSHAFSSSTRIRPYWLDFKSNSKKLSQFVYTAIRDFNDETLKKEFEDFFGSLDRNIKFTSVYPQLMVIFYRLSQESFELSIPFSTKKLYSRDILTMLFAGEIPPFFQYSDDMSALTPYEILYSFDMALKIGVFEAFNISVDDFIAQLVGRISESGLRSLWEWNQRFNDAYSSNPSYSRFVQICGEARGESVVPRRMSPNDFHGSPILSEEILLGFEGIVGSKTSFSNGVTHNLAGAFFMIDPYLDVAEMVRVELPRWLETLEVLETSYRNYLVYAKSFSEEEVASQIPQTRRLKARLKNASIDFYSQFNHRQKEVLSCYYDILAYHMEAKSRILDMERAYLEQVHRDMLRLRNHDLSEMEKRRIQESYWLAGLPDNFKGFDRIEADSYSYNQLDFYLRMSRYLREGLETETESFRPLAPHIEVEFGENLNIDRALYFESNSHAIPFFTSTRDFVSSGLSYLTQSSGGTVEQGSYVSWYGARESEALRKIHRYEVGLMTVFKAREVDYYPMECFVERVCGEKDVLRGRLVEAKDILDAHEKFLDLLRFTATERRIFSYFSNLNKYYDYMLAHIAFAGFVPGAPRRYLGLFDLPADLATRGLYGYTYIFEIDPPEERHAVAADSAYESRRDFLQRGRDYFAAVDPLSRGYFLFPVTQEIEDYLDRQVLNLIHGEIQSFEALVKELRDKDSHYLSLAEEDRPRLDLNFKISPSVPILNPHILYNFEQRVTNFHSATGNCFKNPEVVSCR